MQSSATVVLVALAVACSIGGCKVTRDSAALAQGGCSTRVIVRFAASPDDALLSDLERTNALELEPLDAITDELRVYTLRARDSADDCAEAIDRLRRDERVRSVDLDVRREIHDE